MFILCILEKIDRVMIAPKVFLRWVANKNVVEYQQVQSKHS